VQAATEIGVDWEQLNYPRELSASVRDLWRHEDLAPASNRYSAMVQPHGVVVLKIQPRIPADSVETK